MSPTNILLGSAAFSNDKYDIFSGCVFYNNILLILNYILGILRKSRETAKEESIFGGDFYNAPSAYPNTYIHVDPVVEYDFSGFISLFYKSIIIKKL